MFKNKRFQRVLFVQSLQTSIKTNAREYITKKFQFLSNYCCVVVWKWYQFWKLSRCADAADVNTQPANIFTSSKYTFYQLLAYLTQPTFALTSSFWTDKAGRGALESSPEEGAPTKRFDREILVSRITWSGRDEKNTWLNPCPLETRTTKFIYIYV